MTATIHQLGDKRAPSLDPMIALDRGGHERGQRRHPRADAVQGRADPGARRPSDRRRRQADAADADARQRALLDYTGTRHHKLAAAVEFIHTATLLHDDVVDGSGMRRGKRTANLIWGNPASVLVGDFLFSRAFELMVEDGSLKVLRILSHASAVIAEGEVDQLTAQRRIETGEEHYLHIINAKTAALFAAACRIVAGRRRGGRGSRARARKLTAAISASPSS